MYTTSADLSSIDSSWQSIAIALDASTGKQLWNYTAASDFYSFLYSDGHIYIASSSDDTTNYINSENVNGKICDGGIIALDAKDGTKIWDAQSSASVSSLVLSNGTVYSVTNDGDLDAFNATDGTPDLALQCRHRPWFLQM